MRRVDRASLVGWLGAALTLGLAIAGVAMARRSFVPGPYEDLVAVLRAVGWSVGGDSGAPLDPERDLVLAFGDYFFAGRQEDDQSKLDALEAFVKAGGLLISAAGSGAEALIGDPDYEDQESAPLSFPGALGEQIKPGVLYAERSMSLAPGAEILASTSAGAFAMKASYGAGVIVHFAQDSCFLGPAVLDGEGAVLVNELLRNRWGSRVVLWGRTVESGSGIATFRLASLPAIAPFVACVLVALILSALSLSVRFGSALPDAPDRGRTSLGAVTAIGAFYQRNAARQLADDFLARRFRRWVRANAPGSRDFAEAATVLAERAAFDSSELRVLGEALNGCSAHDLEARREARARFARAIKPDSQRKDRI